MKRLSFVALCVVTLLVLLFSGETRTAEAVTCDPSELSSCLPALKSSAPPSTTCCSKLKAQQPCHCGYLKNPALKQFVDNPNAKRLVTLVKFHLLSVKCCLITVSTGMAAYTIGFAVKQCSE